MTKIQKLIWVVFIILTAFIISNCGCSNPPSYDEINKIILQELKETDKLTNEIPGKIALVVDITQSMRGFVMNPNIGFCKFLDSFHSRFNRTGLTINGLRRQLDNINSISDLFNSNSYKWKATDFSLIKELIDPESVFILISDFQFNRRNDYRGLIAILQECLQEKGYFIQFRGGKLPFDGHVWHELDSEQIEKYKGPRPLYALIIGHQKYFADIDNNFDDFPTWTNKITFVRHLINDFKFSQYSNQLNPKGVPKESSKFFGMYLGKMSSDRHSFTLEVNAPIIKEWFAQPATKVNAETESAAQQNQQTTQPQNSFSNRDIEVDIYKLATDPNNGQLKINTLEFDNILESLEGQIKPDGTLFIQFKTKNLLMCDNFLFKVKIQTRILPGWIKTWSCRADEDMQSISRKTVLLEEFIQSITARVDMAFSLADLYIPVVSD